MSGPSAFRLTGVTDASVPYADLAAGEYRLYFSSTASTFCAKDNTNTVYNLGGLTTEQIQDMIGGTFWQNSTDISFTYNDVGNAISVTVGAFTGDITKAAGSLATVIANNVVTDAKIRQGAGTTVIGRAAGSTGNVADIAAGADDTLLHRRGGTLQFAALDDAAHGNRGGSALHAVAVSGGANGFMLGTDKQRLDAIGTAAPPGTRTLTAGAGLTGGGDLTADRTFDVVANADGSIIVAANDVKVGVINSTQHGNQTATSLHALATTSLHGFMAATDKKKLDGILYDVRTDGGAVGDGAAGGTGTDDAASLRASIATVQTAGGGIVWFGRAKYRINSTVTVTANSVTLLGAGSGYSIDVGGNEVDTAATALIWGGGANTVSMVKVDRTAGGAAVQAISGFRFVGICLDTFQGTTTKTLEMISCKGFHVEDFFFIGGTFAMSCRPKFADDAVNGLGEAPDTSRGYVSRGCIRNIDGSAAANACWTLDGNVAGGGGLSTANTCCNHFQNVQMFHGAGGGMVFTNADSNTSTSMYVQQTGSGVGIDLKGSAVNASFTARNNVFVNCSAGAGGLTSRGGSFPALYNYAICYQVANGEPRPVQEAGSILIWNESAAQAGSVFDQEQGNLVLRMTASQSFASTTVTDLAGLAFPAQPGEKWEVEAEVPANCSSTATSGGITVGVNGPVNSTVEGSVWGVTGTAGAAKMVRLAALGVVANTFIATSGVTAPLLVKATVLVPATMTSTGTAANIKIQGAGAGTTAAQTATVLSGGYLRAQRISL